LIYFTKYLLGSLLLSLVLSSCATRPDSISASHVAHEKFMINTCSELSVLRADARTDLQTYSSKQNTKANWDFATVFFVLIPASQLSGDHKADVALFKGTIEAIETAQAIKGC
jgi:hypothetical protein